MMVTQACIILALLSTLANGAVALVKMGGNDRDFADSRGFMILAIISAVGFVALAS